MQIRHSANFPKNNWVELAKIELPSGYSVAGMVGFSGIDNTNDTAISCRIYDNSPNIYALPKNDCTSIFVNVTIPLNKA